MLRDHVTSGRAVMVWVLHDHETDELRVIDQSFLDRLRDLSDEPSSDPEYRDELDWLAEQGWPEASALTIAMHQGEVRDEESFWAWIANQSSPPAISSAPALSGDNIASLADAVRQ